MKGIFLKSMREIGLTALLFGAAMFGFEVLLAYILPQVLAGVGDIFNQMPFVRTIFSKYRVRS